VVPRTLKIAAALVCGHWLLFTLLKIDQGGSAYAIGQGTGKLVMMGIVVYALLRIAKYGWGVSIFIILGSLVAETRGVLATINAAGAGPGTAIPWTLYSVVNAPLVAALCLLLLETSRAPFRAVRAEKSAA
jgi:hypothetical protein